MATTNNINVRIKSLRDDLKITQVEFSERIGVTQGTLSLMEKGKMSVNNQNIKLICQEFGVREEWLRTGKEPAFKNEEELLKLLGSKLDDLDNMDRRIITEYLKLEAHKKKILKEFIKKMAD